MVGTEAWRCAEEGEAIDVWRRPWIIAWAGYGEDDRV